MSITWPANAATSRIAGRQRPDRGIVPHREWSTSA